ncbi:MAG: O-antigen ligase family protein, partial [Ardenticatenales bacterium]
MPRARRALESIALAAVLVLPWYFAVYTERIFEAEKMAALRAFGGPALIAILALLWRRPAPAAGRSEPGTVRVVPILAHRLATLHPPARRLAVAAAAFWLADALTTAVSRAPLVSLFGSYDRGFGLLSTTALIALGIGAASLAARPGGAERLARAIGASTLPTALYGIFQRVGADPLPWLGDVVTRVSGAAGASVMLGAHLAMALPFAVWATWCAYGAAVQPVERRATGASTELPRPAIEPGGSILRSASTGAHSGVVGAQLQLAAWLVIDVAAIAALLLSGSRGPVLAAAAAGGVTALAMAAPAGRGRLAGALVGAAAAAMLGIVALNRQPAAFGPIAHLPVIDRLAVALDPERSTTRVRLRLWEGTTAAIDDLGARQLIGTGPETMPLVWAAHYPSVLAYDEPRGWVPDRAHNLWLDRWLTTGVLGAASLLALLLTALLAALNGLGLVERRRDAATALAAVLGAGGGAAAAARLLDGGWRLAAPSFGLGLVGGLALWLALAARRRTHPVHAASDGAISPAALHLAALGMLTAFVVETDVGFVVTATGVVLW